MNMKNESSRPGLLDEGWRDFRIMKIVDAISKKGNPQFVITVRDVETGTDVEVYAVSVEGKRWFLKAFLSAMRVEESDDGTFFWDSESLVGKHVGGRVEHEANDWVDNKQVQHNDKRTKIAEWRPSGVVTPAGDVNLGENDDNGPF
jgi:hypothetical protein